MKLFLNILTVLLALLSIAAGVPKLLQLPQEVALLQTIGFDELLVSILGIVQIMGGGLFAWRRTRFVGSTLVVAGFLVSSSALLIGGDLPFALISTIPPALTIALTLRFFNQNRQS